jgi:hypothetical protein
MKSENISTMNYKDFLIFFDINESLNSKSFFELLAEKEELNVP